MKKHIILLFVLLACIYTQAQNTDVKLKYQEAEKAFETGNYQNCIGLLDETEQLLGQSTSNTLHLRIQAENKIWEAKPFESYQQIEKLKNLCNEYLQKYDTAGLSDVYELSKKLPEVSSQEELTQLGEQYQTENQGKRHEKALIEQNMVFVEGGTYIKGARREALEVTVNDFYIAKFETTVKQWNNYLEATGRTENNNIELIRLLELYNHVSKVSNTATGALNVAGGGTTKMLTGLLTNNKHLSYRIPQQDNSAFSRFLPARAYKKRSLSYFNEILYPEILNYCKWLEQQYGGTWRLPTDAEWEYAARNGNTAEHISSEGKNSTRRTNEKYQTYYKDAIPYIELPHAMAKDVVTEKAVGRTTPNALGIYDMIGNVTEICSDFFDRKYYKNSPTDNPKGPEQGKYRTSRGNFIFWANGGILETGDVNAIGFRVVYIPD